MSIKDAATDETSTESLALDQVILKRGMPPMDIEFTVERWGEWTMLMFGESILSMLLVELKYKTGSELSMFYATFFGGFLLTQFVQMIHYRFNDFGVQDHAMRRNILAGVSWRVSSLYFSESLVLLGVGLKCVLYYCQQDEQDDYYIAYRQDYVKLLCISTLVAYLLKQFAIPLHLGFKRYFAVDAPWTSKEKVVIRGLILLKGVTMFGMVCPMFFDVTFTEATWVLASMAILQFLVQYEEKIILEQKRAVTSMSEKLTIHQTQTEGSKMASESDLELTHLREEPPGQVAASAVLVETRPGNSTSTVAL